MKLLNVKSFSSLLSVIFHIVLFVLIFFLFNQKSKSTSYKLIEIGFAGSVPSNSPGSPGSGINEAHSPLPPENPKKNNIKKIEKAKPKIKKVSEISRKEKSSKKKDTKKEDDEAAANNSTGTSSSGKTIGTPGNGSPGNGGSGNGQNGSGLPKKGTPENEQIYYVAVDQMPVPYGGMASINAKAFYPPQAKANKISGTVYVQAFIDEYGKVRKLMVIKGIGYGCDQSAMRAVKETTFQAGLLHGVPVKVQMTVPVSFGSQQ